MLVDNFIIIWYNIHMKFDRVELQRLYENTPNATDIVRDESGNVVAFKYRKYYGNKNRSSRLISVSLRATPQPAIYLAEADFFGKLFDNAERVGDIRVSNGKIVRYSLNDKTYRTDKRDIPRLFASLDYKQFLKHCGQRFYHVDDRLRNGYFSGLLGTNNANLEYYKKHRADFILYDVDFNSAYPACLSLPLPTGKFYERDEWDALPEREKRTFIKFYDIRLNGVDTSFRTWTPPVPFVEYADFDFLMSKTKRFMIASEYRKALIDEIYGADAYVVCGEFYCKTKIYLTLKRVAQTLYRDIQKEKSENGKSALWQKMKIALNSLIGRFGQRDEERVPVSVTKVNSGIFDDVITVNYEVRKKEKPNYLPLCMCVNDITALRLFRMLTETNVLRICHNTDGGLIALPRGYRIITSDKIGWLKATEIPGAEFFACSAIYARPLVFDRATGKTFNTSSIEYDAERECFLRDETFNFNTAHGFESYVNSIPQPVEKWKPFNFRQAEIVFRLQNDPLYIAMKKAGRRPKNASAAELAEWEFKNAVYERAARDFERITNPFDSNVNEVRHAPPRKTEYKQLSIFDATFFKKSTQK